MAAWYAIISAELKVPRVPIHMTGEVAKLSALGTWRYSQGIYRVDPDLIAALANSPLSGSIPCEVLLRLPEWCIYVETPGLRWLNQMLHGFWTHLEWDANTGRHELRFLFDCEDGTVALPLHMGDWSISEAVDRMISEAARQSGSSVLDMYTADDTRELTTHINPLVSIVLYLCSEKPEINDLRLPGTWPVRPKPKKTKKGWRLFPPDKHKIWKVGEQIGAQLKTAIAADNEKSQRAESAESTEHSIRTHLRRGHWHGYWTGPRHEEQKFIYHWISPLVVQGRSEKEQA